jgi:site-specific DNA-cytosine methylase
MSRRVGFQKKNFWKPFNVIDPFVGVGVTCLVVKSAGPSIVGADDLVVGCPPCHGLSSGSKRGT